MDRRDAAGGARARPARAAAALKDNPERQYTPKGFGSSFELHFDHVEEGSAIVPLIALTSALSTEPNAHQYFDQARELVTECIAAPLDKIPADFPLTLKAPEEVTFRVRAGTNIATTLGILLRPDEASIKYPFQPSTTPAAAGIGAGFEYSPQNSTVILGSLNATRLEFKGASVDFEAKTFEGTLDIAFSAQLKQFALVLAAGEEELY